MELADVAIQVGDRVRVHPPLDYCMDHLNNEPATVEYVYLGAALCVRLDCNGQTLSIRTLYVTPLEAPDGD